MLKREHYSPAAIAMAAEAMMPTGTDRMLPLPVVVHMTSLSKSKIYADVKCGAFPAPVKLGPKKSAWRTSDIQRWLASRAPARVAA
ncbi:MAG: AlpA family phage regulatory protein [Hyphomicrobium sp.]|nr:AlpA family phage regulatory protein [Hyphomicrobium sp.]